MLYFLRDRVRYPARRGGNFFKERFANRAVSGRARLYGLAAACTSNNSTSKIKVAFGGMTGGAPLAP